MGRSPSWFKVLTLLSAWLSATACSSDGAGGDGLATDPASTVSGALSPAEGGSVEAPTGDRLEVPAGAVAQEVEVVLAPLVLPSDPSLDVLGGVDLQPTGLAFREEATLTLRLATPLAPGTELRLASTAGSGDEPFGDVGALFIVGPSGETATGPLWDFSRKVVQKNCHSGTRDALLGAWDGLQGRDPASLASATGVPPSALQTCELHADPLQSLLSPFFEPCYEFPAGAPFEQAALADVAARVDDGRQVVMLFGSQIGGAEGARTGVAHSAVLRHVGDEIVIRNQIYVTNSNRLREMELAGRTTTVDLPLDEIDMPGGLRDLRNGEVYATAVLGQQVPNRDARPRAWPHVVVYCELEEPVACVPQCEGLECGDDGCGGLCGTCASGTCVDGECQAECVPDCAGLECGGDGCGGLCGTCASGFCVGGTCQAECVPSCEGMACGPDGCGGVCGTCEGDANCGPDHTCVGPCAACSAGVCPNYGFELGDWPYWNLSGDASFVTALDSASPPEGQHMALISSGLQLQQATVLTRSLCDPAAISTIRFRWKAYSEEFLEFCGSEFQDRFRVRLELGGGGGELLFQRAVDDLCPADACEGCGDAFVGLEPADIGFDIGDVHTTPWQEAQVDVSSTTANLADGEGLTLVFEVTDVGDSIYDTAILLDDVRAE